MDSSSAINFPEIKQYFETLRSYHLLLINLVATDATKYYDNNNTFFATPNEVSGFRPKLANVASGTIYFKHSDEGTDFTTCAAETSTFIKYALMYKYYNMLRDDTMSYVLSPKITLHKLIGRWTRTNNINTVLVKEFYESV